MNQSNSALKRFVQLLDSGNTISADEFLSAEPADLAPEIVSQIVRMEIERNSGENNFENNTEFNILKDDKSLLFYVSQNGDSASTHAADSEPTFKIPNPFGKFELLEAIGCGGMGLVFKARQTDVNRIVALKVIRPDIWVKLTDQKRQELRNRIKNEAEIGSAVTHPNVVTIYETGGVGDIPYLSMQLINGTTLLNKLRDPGVGVRESAQIFSSVAKGLQRLHETGGIHRDVTPRNIFLTSNNEVVLGDFGLAKVPDNGEELTQEKVLLGTISYTSPEQIKDARCVDRRSDVYGLGASLYHCLTQRPPFTGETDSEKLSKILMEDPVSISTLDSSVSKDLEAVCLKCLEKKPEHRYQSASDFAADLDNFLAGKPTIARPVGRLGQLSKWFSREPVVGWLSALSLLLALTVGLVSALGWRNSTIVNRELQKSIQQKDNNQLLSASLIDETLKIANRNLGDSQSNGQFRKELIDSLAKYAKSFSDQEDFGPFNFANARVNLTLSSLLQREGRHDDAMAHLDFAEKFFATTNNRDYRRDFYLSEIAGHQAFYFKSRGEYETALDSLEIAIEHLERSESEVKHLKRWNLSSEKSLILSRIGKIDEASAMAEDLLNAEIDNTNPSADEYVHFGVARSRLLHVVFQNTNAGPQRYELLRPKYFEQYEYWKAGLEKYPNSLKVQMELAASLFPLGSVTSGEPEKSFWYREEAFKICRQLVRENPAHVGLKHRLLAATGNVIAGNLDLEGGDIERADTVFSESHAVVEELIKNRHSMGTKFRYLQLLANGGLVAMRKSDFTKARIRIEKAVQILRNLTQAKPDLQDAKARLVENLERLAKLEIELDEFEKANALLREAEELLPAVTLPRFSLLPDLVGLAYVSLAIEREANDESYSQNMKRGLELAGYDVGGDYFEQFLDFLETESKPDEALQLIDAALEELNDQSLIKKLQVRRKRLDGEK